MKSCPSASGSTTIIQKRACFVVVQKVDLQRLKERTDEELIYCFVVEDLESDGNNYFWFLVR
jgi:hypothetical protein